MQTTLPLSKQEQAYLDKLVDKLNKKTKVSDIQALILELNKKSQRSDLETQKLRLLLKSEKIREDDLEIKRQLQATLKAEQEQANQLEQRKENSIGKKIIYAIRENILLGKDYPYSKLLKKMVEQGLFSEEEQAMLLEFLVESTNPCESHSKNDSESTAENSAEDLKDKNNKIVENENPKSETHDSNQITQPNETIAKNSTEIIENSDSQNNQAAIENNLSQPNNPSVMPNLHDQADINLDNQQR